MDGGGGGSIGESERLHYFFIDKRQKNITNFGIDDTSLVFADMAE